jgi:hypothetical protein
MHLQRLAGTLARRELLDELTNETELSARREELSALLESFDDAFGHLAKRYARANKIARAMPSLVRCDIACDLRYLPGTTADEYELAPGAVSRIDRDERRDAPALFQCTEPGLQRLIDKLKEAQARLVRLGRLSEIHASQQE